MIANLKRARDLIAGGWSEPFTLDTDGRWCSPRAEGVVTLSVQDALILVDAFPDGWDALEAIVSPGLAAWRQLEVPEPISDDVVRLAIALARAASGQSSLGEWLERPGRQLAEVLEKFDIAVLRAAREVH